MRKLIFLTVLTLLTLSSALCAQDNLQSPVNNSVQLAPLDAQPYPNAVLLQDSLGNKYVNLTLKVLPNGLFEAPNGTGIDGSTLIAFKNLSPEEILYIEKFIEYRVAKRGLNE